MKTARKINKFLIETICLAFFISLGVCAFSQEAKQEVLPAGKLKIMQGEVTWIGRERIAVVYKKAADGKSEEEMLLPFDKNVELEHLRSLSDISTGDIVSIVFEESTEEGLDGPRLTRKVKKIGYIRKGKKIGIGEKEEQAVKQEETQVLRSE